MKGRGGNKHDLRLNDLLKEVEGLKNLDYKQLLAKKLYLEQNYGSEFKDLYQKYAKDKNKVKNPEIVSEKKELNDKIIKLLGKMHHYNKVWTSGILQEQQISALKDLANRIKPMDAARSEEFKKFREDLKKMGPAVRGEMILNKEIKNETRELVNDLIQDLEDTAALDEKKKIFKGKIAANKIGKQYKIHKEQLKVKKGMEKTAQYKHHELKAFNKKVKTTLGNLREKLKDSTESMHEVIKNIKKPKQEKIEEEKAEAPKIEEQKVEVPKKKEKKTKTEEEVVAKREEIDSNFTHKVLLKYLKPLIEKGEKISKNSKSKAMDYIMQSSEAKKIIKLALADKKASEKKAAGKKES